MYKYREAGEALTKKMGVNPYKYNYKENIELRNKIYPGMAKALKLIELSQADAEYTDKGFTLDDALNNLYMNVRLLESAIGIDSVVEKDGERVVLPSALTSLEEIRDEVLDMFFDIYNNDELPFELDDDKKERIDDLKRLRGWL